MPIFTFTHSYLDGNPLFEIDLDNLRNSIQTAIDSTKLDYQNIQPASLNPSNFEDPGIFVQPGTVVAYAGTSAPTGWLIANGATLSTSAYPNLFATIGYTYGGSGSSFILPNLQELFSVGLDNLGTQGAANRVTSSISGASTTLGATFGNQDIPTHTHTAANITVSGTSDHFHQYSGTHTHSGNDQAAISGSGTNLPQGRVGTTQINGTSDRALNVSSTGITFGVDGAHNHQVTSFATDVNSNNSGSATGTVQPTIILNKIIKY